jgi:D-3-phosphoglycerate dehydrogenase / 2-oxoglutarate reductase
MPIRVLVSTTSFLDTPGPHRDKLKEIGYQVVPARGPLTEEQLLDLVRDQEQFDGFLCGEDEFTEKVLEAITPRAKVISKYGVGLEKINIETAKRLGIKVVNTPRVNHTTVAELTFGLLINATRKISEHNSKVHQGRWERHTGVELCGKTLGVFGLGRVGKEVVKRALAFEMKVLVYNTNWSASHSSFVSEMGRIFSDPVFSECSPSVKYADSIDEVLRQSDFVTLHINLSKENRAFLDRGKLALCKRGAFIINVSRGALVDQEAMAESIRRGHIAGYAADVVEPEPVRPDNPLLGLQNVILTPHIGSRTYESVARQGAAALQNIIDVLGT